MIPPIRQEMLAKLARLCELAPDVRMGQLVAHLGFLAEDRCDRTLWDVEDQDLLAVIEQHHTELSKRQEHVA